MAAGPWCCFQSADPNKFGVNERPTAASLCLAAQLLGQLNSPSEALIRAETHIALQTAINAMEPLDREILALGHFEELSNGEAANELGIEPAAASKPIVRTLRRLECISQDLGLVEPAP
jgi:RNA polymerase sigma-70 factor (ECF subfamily)